MMILFNSQRKLLLFLSSALFLISFIGVQKCALVSALSLPSRIRFTMSASSSSGSSNAAVEQTQLLLSTRRNRLYQALSSPIQGKLSISPEISIKESFDPTSLLLQATYINQLSESLRVKAKANAVFWSSSSPSLDSLQQFVLEQQTANGKIPPPLPLIYCCTTTTTTKPTLIDSELLSNISNLGVCGILVPLFNGKEISNTEEILNDDDSSTNIINENVLSHGLHAIPEIILHPKSSWTESEVEALVTTIKTKYGFVDPVAIVVTFGLSSPNEDEITTTASPPILKLPTKQQLGGTPILGSVRASAGDDDGRSLLNNHVSHLKAAGFAGAILRADCVPYFGSNNIEFLSKFWYSIISQLKSVRSKAFGGFRTKNQMDDSTGAAAWAKYTSKLLDEGVLPSSASDTSSSSSSSELNTDRGDYKGF
jgi:hypothetical protein